MNKLLITDPNPNFTKKADESVPHRPAGFQLMKHKSKEVNILYRWGLHSAK